MLLHKVFNLNVSPGSSSIILYSSSRILHFSQAAMRQRDITSKDVEMLPRSDKARPAYYLTAKAKGPCVLKVSL